MFICYCPKTAKLLNSVTAAIVIHQLNYFYEISGNTSLCVEKISNIRSIPPCKVVAASDILQKKGMVDFAGGEITLILDVFVKKSSSKKQIVEDDQYILFRKIWVHHHNEQLKENNNKLILPKYDAKNNKLLKMVYSRFVEMLKDSNCDFENKIRSFCTKFIEISKQVDNKGLAPFGFSTLSPSNVYNNFYYILSRMAEKKSIKTNLIPDY